MPEENTYPEVVRHCSLSSHIISIRIKLVLLPSSGELPVTIPEQCHHAQVTEMNQITQHLVD
jgi:hypothetical protein